ncbi:hypothetical protein BJ875DRAFT_454322 [Amylocarpus encephaloides]|uniref:Uncharacterized protein n=1 Tax=Amylocarpus encephaloides TaxID=45428 RepID=A0A9P8C9J8_9HELO|nr:hypothetical protein BJ875DRAFT_454322 [Amylocarpus encephaloides]
MFTSIKVLGLLAIAFSSTSALPIEVRDKQKTYSGGGVNLTNKGATKQTFNFFDNIANGVGTAEPDYKNYLKFDGDINTVGPGKTVFIPLYDEFKGRIQRGTELPATFVEINIKASGVGPNQDGKGHGNISLQQGCDGAATVKSTTNKSNGGFTQDVLTGAPEEAFAKDDVWGGGKEILKDGKKVLGSTMGNWSQKPNAAAVEWLKSKKVPANKVYYLNDAWNSGSGVEDVSTDNGVFDVTFY